MNTIHICSDCDTILTTENTQQYEGFDAGGFIVGRPFGVQKSSFLKCDKCFDLAIDNHLENQYG
jgi:hypothetical protein